MLLISFCSDVFPEEVSQATEISQDKKCIICHVSESETFKDLIEQKVFDVEISSMVTKETCYSCHNVSVKDSREIFTKRHHPVKVVPSRRVKIPPEYTLNEKGQMDCGTCHTPHTGKLEEGTTSFLREPNIDSSMCVRCHISLTAGPRYGEHKINVSIMSDPAVITSRGGKLGKNYYIICESCHVVHDAPNKKLLIYYEKDEDFCTLCHDENPSMEGVGFGMDSHPIDQKTFKSEMPHTWPNGQFIRKMQDGSFKCQTCHTVHYGYKGQLAYKNNGGELCIACHQGKTNTEDDEIKKNHVIVTGDEKKEGVNCSGCHRAHNAFYDPESEANRLLIKNNDNSELCYECHLDKKTDNIIIVELSGNHPNNMPFTKTKKMRRKLKARGGKSGIKNNIICNSCHSVHDARTKEASLVMEKHMLCLYCHYDENYLSPPAASRGTHPTNILPDEAIISKEAQETGQTSILGEIICLTCHKVHGAKQNSKLLSYYSNKDDYCISCHTNMQRMLKGPHNLMNSAPDVKNILGQTAEESGMCGACHSTHLFSREIGSDTEDVINKVCLSCHSEDGPGKNVRKDGMYNHTDDAYVEDRFKIYALPIYTNYGKKVSRNGKITCATCHNIHENKEGLVGKKLLRIQSNIISNLCFNCHIEKMSVLGTDHDFSTIGLDTHENIKGETIYEGGVCSSCHVAHGGTAKFSYSQPLSEDVDKDQDAVTLVCFNCHNEIGLARSKPVKPYGHKVNVDMKNVSLIKGKLPLYDSQGNRGRGKKVLCSTCHDPHVWGTLEAMALSDDIPEETISNNFLRIADRNPDTLCNLCHKEEALIAGTVHDLGSRKGYDESEGICRRCHSIHDPMFGTFIWSYKLKIKNKSDNFAQKVCFSCHSRRNFFGKKKKRKYNHPINLKMNLKYGKKKVITTLPIYNNEWEKDPEYGMIVCFTCHDIHRWNPKSALKRGGYGIEGETANSFLRVAANDGYLCTNCHEKKIAIFNTEHDLRMYAPFEENRKGLIPEESGPCGVCHIVHNASKDNILLWNRKLGKSRNKLFGTCTSCHSDGKIAETSQVQLSYHIPQDQSIVTYGKKLIFMQIMSFKYTGGSLDEPVFQLYEDNKKAKSEGFLQCASCHDPHKWSADPYIVSKGEPEEGDITNSFLKQQIPEKAINTVCSECHRDEEVEKFTDYHKPPPDVDEPFDVDDYYDDDYYDDDYYNDDYYDY